jgi:hypothetical protein
VGLFKFRTRGLWLLIGLAFAAYWPLAFFVFAKARLLKRPSMGTS